MDSKETTNPIEEGKLPTPRSILVFQTLVRSGFESMEKLASRCNIPVESATNAINELKTFGLISRDPYPTRLDAFIEPSDACRYLERMGYSWLPSVGEFQRVECDTHSVHWHKAGAEVIKDADIVAKLRSV